MTGFSAFGNDGVCREGGPILKLALCSLPVLGASVLCGCAGRPRSASPVMRASPASSRPASSANVTFTDITDQAGIKFEHFNGTFGKKWMPETTGGGCAFIDFDRDGNEDILFVNSGQFDTPAATYND